MTQNAFGNVQSYPTVSIYRSIIVAQGKGKNGGCLRSIKDESNPPDIVIRLRSVSRHSRARNEMIGGGALPRSESLLRAKRKNAAVWGLPVRYDGQYISEYRNAR